MSIKKFFIKHLISTLRNERGDIGGAINSLFGGGDEETTQTVVQQNPLQERLMNVFLPEYQKLAPQVSGILQNKMTGTALPEDLAATIGKYYGQAGEKYGNYFSSRNMLDSGASQQAFQGLTQEEIATKLSTLLGQQREGLGQTLQFMGMQPSSGTQTTTSTGTTTASAGIDWSGIGGLLSKLNLGSPTATPIGGSGYIPQSQGGLTEYFNQNYSGYNF